MSDQTLRHVAYFRAYKITVNAVLSQGHSVPHRKTHSLSNYKPTTNTKQT